jgi:hypothetical protein
METMILLAASRNMMTQVLSALTFFVAVAAIY